MLTVDLFGVKATAATLTEALGSVLDDAENSRRTTVEFLAVNNLVAATRVRDFAAVMRTFDYSFADGMPICWMTQAALGRKRAERVTAREFMWRCCAEAQARGIPIYLYGCTAQTIEALRANLQRAFPALFIAGAQASVFRPLTPAEEDRLIDTVNASGARLLFVALGCPLQEEFVARQKGRFHAVQLCVGSAFPGLAGEVKVAPLPLQRLGLEWLYRVVQEPRRLWRRYLTTNTLFLMMLVRSGLVRLLRRPITR